MWGRDHFMVAGRITWDFRRVNATYYVFISEKDVQDGKVSIERILSEIPKAKVKFMRAEIIKLIPRIIYTDPRFRLDAVEEAFDVTIERVLERVDKLRMGLCSSLSLKEELTWKHSLSVTVGEQNWAVSL
ncbi:PREDICTED: xyloglucan galactosyltransferase MUR3-like [Lupinus angustifolius]|uniref:xyloglucan galactosyltransferase MUR3-like n=1 Tax=Lupinus angustifolius TaxID=3871 RepID=UPI00092F92BA|nr:PREDICTED: xyloglucan galactosyltransferase MUR3-like [Lupinus angustifolius]